MLPAVSLVSLFRARVAENEHGKSSGHARGRSMLVPLLAFLVSDWLDEQGWGCSCTAVGGLVGMVMLGGAGLQWPALGLLALASWPLLGVAHVVLLRCVLVYHTLNSWLRWAWALRVRGFWRVTRNIRFAVLSACVLGGTAAAAFLPVTHSTSVEELTQESAGRAIEKLYQGRC